MNEETRQAIAAVLRWHLESGVDECNGNVARNRYGESVAAKEKSPPPPLHPDPVPESAPPSRPAPEAAQAAAAGSAAGLASAAASLETLKAALERFDGCALAKTATNLVFSDGSPSARLVLIGEAPGAEEDRQGLPFVGASGQLLDRMLASIGLDRSQVFISNTVFWRPPGNRAPTSQEVAACMPFVLRMIELIQPSMLVALGGPAAMALLGRTESVSRLRGRWFPFQSAAMAQPIPATALFHPAYLLRSPGQKRLAWRDLLAIKRRLSPL